MAAILKTADTETEETGEGLQHDDGHSHLFAAGIPNRVSYDPTFAFELAVIIQDGLRRMYHEQLRHHLTRTQMTHLQEQPVQASRSSTSNDEC
jgi:pyruvate dehydrogenase E1 component